jgi:hypothetical protein
MIDSQNVLQMWGSNEFSQVCHSTIILHVNLTVSWQCTQLAAGDDAGGPGRRPSPVGKFSAKGMRVLSIACGGSHTLAVGGVEAVLSSREHCCGIYRPLSRSCPRALSQLVRYSPGVLEPLVNSGWAKYV